jgi:glycosyltransferase involved in cell wall biosynthesis
MRIAYVINSMEGGGAALPAPGILQVLMRHGAEVAVFALSRRDGRAMAPIRALGISLEVCPLSESDHPRALAWLTAQVRAWRADVIWTSLTRATLLGQIVGRRLKRPVVSWQHAGYLKPANLLLLRARREASALWVADSRRITELTAARLRIGPDRLTTWPLFALDPTAPRATPWRRDETIRVGSLGRLHPVKGYDVLIEALRQLKARGFQAPAPFSVEIAGDGTERARLERQIAAAGLSNVRLTGFEGTPKAFLAGLHLYVQSSRSEGLCVAAHEAMQAGLPAVVSDVGELRYSVQSGRSGLVVPAGCAWTLANALGKALSSPERLADKGRAARRVIETSFSVEQFDAKGAAILRRLGRLVPAAAI